MTRHLARIGAEIPGLTAASEPAATGHDGCDSDIWLDGGELSAVEKQLIEERFSDFAKHPETSIPWAVAEDELKQRFGP